MNAPVPRSVGDALERALRDVSLDDKYTLERGRAFMSGTQALVRLPMLQRERDRAAGLNTAGFVTGYRGSPLGGVDQALWKARRHLSAHQIVFQPGLNEDLAATSLWGYTTRRDLSQFGSFLMMGLIGIIIASLVNIFLRSSGLEWVISVVGVVVFAGLTAWDTQKIKEMYNPMDDGTVAGRKVVMGALSLYLDFINLFLMLLRLFGDRR